MTVPQQPADTDAETSEDSTHDKTLWKDLGKTTLVRSASEPPDDLDLERLVTRRAI